MFISVWEYVFIRMEDSMYRSVWEYMNICDYENMSVMFVCVTMNEKVLSVSVCKSVCVCPVKISRWDH